MNKNEVDEMIKYIGAAEGVVTSERLDTLFFTGADTSQIVVDLRDELLKNSAIPQGIDRLVTNKVDFEIVIGRTADGRQYIESISEVVDTTPFEIFKTKALIQRNPETQEYDAVNEPSEQLISKVAAYLPEEERNEFYPFLKEVWPNILKVEKKGV